MKILMLACSQNGYRLMQKVSNNWIKNDGEIEIICKVKCSRLPEISMQQSVSGCVEEWFEKVDGIVFFAATGIAVRSIAPCIRHKALDPAVVVVDESGKFSISLLSGHMGGANELAERMASFCGAIPVITTATDRERRFAVDDYARRHDLAVTDWKMAKELAVSVLEGESIGLYIDRYIKKADYLETFPEEVKVYDDQAASETKRDADISASEAEDERIQKGMQISYRRSVKPRFAATLYLVPRQFVVGIGCRRGTSLEQFREAVERCLAEENIRPEAVCAVASIDLKKDEPGLLCYCEQENLPFVTFSAEELKMIPGDYEESAFVEQVTGVSNVCERSAVAEAGGELICRKKVYDGVTVAVAVKG